MARFVEWSKLNDAPEDIPYLLSRLDEYGGPNSYPNYAVGWAMAGSTPCTWGITFAHAGGNIAGMVDALAEGHQGQGREAAAIPPRHRHRADDPGSGWCAGAEVGLRRAAATHARRQHAVLVQGCEGATTATSRSTTRLLGNRSIYHDGWIAAVVHTVSVGSRGIGPRLRQGQMGAVQHARGLRSCDRSRREVPGKGRGR